MSFTGQSTYQASLLGSQDSRITAAETAILANKATYDTKVAAIDAKDTEQDGRLDAVEGRVTSLETDISGRVQSEINDKVAQATFDALATELRDADSALSTALATKVAQTVQQQTDDAQNELINSKVSQSDYDSYVSSNDAAVASKVDQTEYDSYVSSNDAAVASKVAQSDYDTFVSTVTANVSGKVSQSTYDSYVSTNDAAVASKVSQSDYDTFVSLTTSNLNDKVSQASYDSYVSSNDAAVNSKVAQTTYDAYVSLNNSAVTSKVAQVDFDAYTSATDSALNGKASQSALDSYIASNDSAVAGKADQSALDSYISSNDSAVASKVAQTDYDTKVASVDNYIYNFESRFNAVEEYIRAMLATYTIGLPDGTNYVYTGKQQQLSTPPPPFEVVGLRPAGTGTWLFCLQFTQNGYNSLLGDVLFNLDMAAAGGGLQAFSKADVNSNSLYIEIPLYQTRIAGTSDWRIAEHPLPFNIEYRDSQTNVLYTKTFTQTLFDTLPKLDTWTPETPQNVSYNSTTKKLTFTVSNAYAIDFIDLNINGTWYQVEDTDVIVSYDRNNDGVKDNGSESLGIDSVTIDLHKSPVTVTGTVEIHVRYDKITGNTDTGFAQITV